MPAKRGLTTRRKQPQEDLVDADAQRHDLSFAVAAGMLRRVNSWSYFPHCEITLDFGAGKASNSSIGRNLAA
jgi:hypothetical protein